MPACLLAMHTAEMFMIYLCVSVRRPTIEMLHFVNNLVHVFHHSNRTGTMTVFKTNKQKYGHRKEVSKALSMQAWWASTDEHQCEISEQIGWILWFQMKDMVAMCQHKIKNYPERCDMKLWHLHATVQYTCMSVNALEYVNTHVYTPWAHMQKCCFVWVVIDHSILVGNCIWLL